MDAERYETIGGKRVRVYVNGKGHRHDTTCIDYKWYKVFPADYTEKREQIGVARVVAIGSVKTEDGYEKAVIQFKAVVGYGAGMKYGYGVYTLKGGGVENRGGELVQLHHEGFSFDYDGKRFCAFADDEENDLIGWMKSHEDASGKEVIL